MSAVLPDVLSKGLRLVICGYAVGDASAARQAYYAGPGNKFWRTLHEVGLTPVRLAPQEYARLPEFGIGLTDLAKEAHGRDRAIGRGDLGVTALRRKILRYAPCVLCFNGKKAAEAFLGRDVDYGLQPERIGLTRLFVAPSTSGAASGYWDVSYWRQVATLSRSRAGDAPA